MPLPTRLTQALHQTPGQGRGKGMAWVRQFSHFPPPMGKMARSPHAESASTMCLGYKPEPVGGNGHKAFTEPGAKERPTRDRWYDAEHLKLDLAVDLVKKHVKGTAAMSMKLLRPS